MTVSWNKIIILDNNGEKRKEDYKITRKMYKICGKAKETFKGDMGMIKQIFGLFSFKSSFIMLIFKAIAIL